MGRALQSPNSRTRWYLKSYHTNREGGRQLTQHVPLEKHSPDVLKSLSLCGGIIACPEEQVHKAKQKPVKRNEAGRALALRLSWSTCVSSINRCASLKEHLCLCFNTCTAINLNVIKIPNGVEKAMYLPGFTWHTTKMFRICVKFILGANSCKWLSVNHPPDTEAMATALQQWQLYGEVEAD